jgi:hypothetical protein
MTYIYAATNKTSTKIGITKDIERRMKALFSIAGKAGKIKSTFDEVPF